MVTVRKWFFGCAPCWWFVPVYVTWLIMTRRRGTCVRISIQQQAGVCRFQMKISFYFTFVIFNILPVKKWYNEKIQANSSSQCCSHVLSLLQINFIQPHKRVFVIMVERSCKRPWTSSVRGSAWSDRVFKARSPTWLPEVVCHGIIWDQIVDAKFPAGCNNPMWLLWNLLHLEIW